MNYPTMEEVEAADRFQLGQWYRHLPSARSEHELEIIQVVCSRFTALGGWNVETSKAVGWENVE